MAISRRLRLVNFKIFSNHGGDWGRRNIVVILKNLILTWHFCRNIVVLWPKIHCSTNKSYYLETNPYIWWVWNIWDLVVFRTSIFRLYFLKPSAVFTYISRNFCPQMLIDHFLENSRCLERNHIKKFSLTWPEVLISGRSKIPVKNSKSVQWAVQVTAPNPQFTSIFLTKITGSHQIVGEHNMSKLYLEFKRKLKKLRKNFYPFTL